MKKTTGKLTEKDSQSKTIKLLFFQDNSMAKILALIQLLRPFNCIMAALAVLIGYIVSINILEWNNQVLLAMIAAFLICGAGQAINDYFDAAIDKKKNPKKPIPSGAVSTKTVLVYSFALFALGNLTAAFVNQTALAIALAFTVLLVFYSAFLGKIKALGNWVVGAGTAFTLLFGATLSGNYNVIVFLAASALLLNVVREIIKDTEDIAVDKGFKKSLPMLLDKNEILAILIMLCTIAFALSIVPFVQKQFGNSLFLVVILAANALFGYALFSFAKTKYCFAQQLMKAGMLLALAGFLAGVL